MVKEFRYLSDTIGAREGAFDGVITRTRSGWFKVRDLVLLLTSRGLPLRAKGRLYHSCVCSIMLYGSETWPVKEKHVIRTGRNGASIVRSM